MIEYLKGVRVIPGVIGGKERGSGGAVVSTDSLFAFPVNHD